MSLGKLTVDLLNWLEAQIKALEIDGEPAFQEVKILRKGKVGKFPVCRIEPMRDTLTEQTGSKDWHSIFITCACGQRNQNIEKGMKDIINRAAEIHKLIVRNRTMDNQVHDAHVVEFSPEWEPRSKLAEEWCLVNLRCRKTIEVT